MIAAVAWPEVAARAAAFLHSVTDPLRVTTLEMIDDGGIMLVAIGFLGAGVLFADIVATFKRGSRQIRSGGERRPGGLKDRAGAVGRVTDQQAASHATPPRSSPGQAITRVGADPAHAGDGSHDGAVDLLSHTAAAAPTTLKPAPSKTRSRSADRGDERAAYRWLSLTPRPRKRRRFGVDEAA